MLASIKKYSLCMIFVAFSMSIYVPLYGMQKQTSLSIPQRLGLRAMIISYASNMWSWLCKEQYSADLFSIFRQAESLDYSDVQAIKYLLSKGAEVTWNHGHAFDLLYRACELRRPDMFELILDNGASDRMKNAILDKILDRDGYGNKGLTEIGILVKRGIVNPNVTTQRGLPLLHYVASGKSIEVMKLLIKAGAEPMVKHEYEGKMITAHELALMSIINSKKAPFVEDIKFLFESGIDLNSLSCCSINSHATMPLLCCAIEHEYEDAVELIVAMGGDLHTRTEKINEQFKNLTPLHMAVLTGNNNIIRCLIRAGAHPGLKAICNGKSVTPGEFAHDEELLEQEQLLSDYRSICYEVAQKKLGTTSLYTGLEFRSRGIPFGQRTMLKNFNTNK